MSHARPALLACAALAVAVAVTPASAAPPLQLPALTRIASKATGLKAKRKVAVVRLAPAAMDARAAAILDRDYPPDQQEYDEHVYTALGLLRPADSLRPALVQTYARGVRGLYDPVTRRLYVRNAADVRTAVLHELVHALQDQAFDLRRLSGLRRGQRDAGLAATAAIEGATTLFTDFVVPAPARTVQSHNGSRILNFLGLEAEFAYTTGLRFAATLRNLGGNAALYGALRRFPTSTEQIFHVDAFLSREATESVVLPDNAAGLTLERQDTFGELDVRAVLAIYQVPRLDHAGEGWAGGRSAVYRDVAGNQDVAIVLTFDTELDALEWREAVQTFVNEAFHADAPGAPANVACEADLCWSVGQQVAFSRSGTRTALTFGRSTPQVAALARALAQPR